MTRIFRILFWGATAFALIMAMWPIGTPVPTAGLGDKWQHMIAFFTLTILAGIAYPSRSLSFIAVAMILLGLGIEIAQWALPMLNREGSALDWLADGIATGVALMLVAALRATGRWGSAKPRR